MPENVFEDLDSTRSILFDVVGERIKEGWLKKQVIRDKYRHMHWGGREADGEGE